MPMSGGSLQGGLGLGPRLTPNPTALVNGEIGYRCTESGKKQKKAIPSKELEGPAPEKLPRGSSRRPAGQLPARRPRCPTLTLSSSAGFHRACSRFTGWPGLAWPASLDPNHSGARRTAIRLVTERRGGAATPPQRQRTAGFAHTSRKAGLCGFPAFRLPITEVGSGRSMSRALKQNAKCLSATRCLPLGSRFGPQQRRKVLQFVPDRPGPPDRARQGPTGPGPRRSGDALLGASAERQLRSRDPTQHALHIPAIPAERRWALGTCWRCHASSMPMPNFGQISTLVLSGSVGNRPTHRGTLSIVWRFCGPSIHIISDAAERGGSEPVEPVYRVVCLSA